MKIRRDGILETMPITGSVSSTLIGSGSTGIVAVKPAYSSSIASDASLVVSISPNFGTTGRFPVTLGDPGTEDVFGQVVTSTRVPQIQIPFYQVAPSGSLTITTTNGGTAVQGTGLGTFTTSTNVNGTSKAVSPSSISYGAHYEIYAAVTVSFTTPTSANSYQRIGIYNTTDGFSFGYNGTSFGIWLRYNSSDTFIAQTSWNTDTLSATIGSKFTSNGAPVSLNKTNINLYRIRFGWLGIAPIVFEVLSPDGNFVVVHTARFPNSQTTVSITNPALPLTLDISKTSADATDLVMSCGCWVAGVTSGIGSPLISGFGSISSNGGVVQLPTAGHTTIAVNVTGTWTGILAWQCSTDGMNWVSTSVFNATTNTFVTTSTSNLTAEISLGGYRHFRIIATAWTSGGAIITYSGGVGLSFLTNQSLISDASNNGPAAVKPALSASLTSDPALVVALSPNSPVKATIKPLYGTRNLIMSCTLSSLANNAYRCALVQDNTTELYDDVLFTVKATTATAATSATGYINVYAYGTIDGGTTYPDNVTGTDVVIVPTTPPNLVLLAQITANANAKTYIAGPFSFCRQYGLDRMPQKWGLVVNNVTGATLNATGSYGITYQGINGQLV